MHSSIVAHLLSNGSQDAFSSLSDSILAHRIIGELYQQEADYENTIKVSESGLELVNRAEQNWGRPINL